MTNTLEFRFAVLGFLLGCAVVLYSLLANSEPRSHTSSTYGMEQETGQMYAFVAGGGGAGGGFSGGGSSTTLAPVYQPPSAAVVAQFFLLDTKQPEKAIEILGNAGDSSTRIVSIQWLLNAPAREVPYGLTQDEKRLVAAEIENNLYDVLPQLLDLLTSSSKSLASIDDERKFETSKRCIDAFVRIARYQNKRGGAQAAESAAEAASRESLRFSKLSLARIGQTTGSIEASMQSDASGIAAGNSGKRALIFLWPVLFSALSFSIAHAARPVLDAIGKAVVAKVLVDRQSGNEKANATATT